MAIERVLIKQLAGVEDLSVGNGTELQTRNGTDYSVTKVGGATLPYNAAGGISIKTAIDNAASNASTALSTANTAKATADSVASALPNLVTKTSDTGAALLPAGTTAQRPSAPSDGYARVNTDNNSIEVYSGGSWTTLGDISDLITATLTHNMTSDGTYTLTASENFYGRLVITDTGSLLTTTRNIRLNAVARTVFVKNDTAQPLVFKPVGGTGITVAPGDSVGLVNDGTNVVLQNEDIHPLDYQFPMIMGTGNLGNVTYSVSTNLDSGVYQYENLTINSGVVITPTEASNAGFVFVVKDTFTYAGVLNLSGRGGAPAINKDTPTLYGNLGAAGGGAGGLLAGFAEAGREGGDTTFLNGGTRGLDTAGGNGESCSSLSDGEKFYRERLSIFQLFPSYLIPSSAPFYWDLGNQPVVPIGGAGGGNIIGVSGDPMSYGGGAVVVICDTFDFQGSGQFQAAGADAIYQAPSYGSGGGGGGALIVFARKVINDAGSINVAGGLGYVTALSGGNGGTGYYVLITPTSRTERTT